MNFIHVLKNYLFSSNWNLINPSYRFSPVFYQRFISDFLLRLYIFLPFIITTAIMIHNGYFSETAETMIQSGQNLYGYLLVIFVYIPIFLFFLSSLIASIIGSILKRNIFALEEEESKETPILPNNYKEAFLSAWKNLWYLTLETFVLIFIGKIIIEMIAINTIALDLFGILKAVLITVVTSGVLAAIVSLPWLKKKKSTPELQSNDTVIG